MKYDDAVEHGAMALFGEKYAEDVRVLTMGDGYSVELCGGTHVRHTGDIGVLRIVQETGIAAGVRRIEAVTAFGALERFRASESVLGDAAGLLKTNEQDLLEKLHNLIEENRANLKRIEELNQQLAANQGSDIAEGLEEISGIAVIAAQVSGDGQALMQTLDTLKSQQAEYAIVLVQTNDQKVNMVTAVSAGAQDRLTAPELLSAAGALVGVKGGGRPDLARGGGGSKPEAIEEALAAARSLAKEKLS